MAKHSKKRVLVGISGGIAAYKTCELVRLLKKAGHKVRVIMTPHATQFITPLTLQALSGKPVLVDTFQPVHQDGMDHIRLAEKADLFVVAPASANTIGEIAHGLSSNLLTTTLCAFSGPVVIAPAMNPSMFENPAVQRNLNMLRDRGCHLLGPHEGEMACGHTGLGRMVESQEIFHYCQKEFFSLRKDFQNVQVLVTAVPTRESLDRVRFLTNHSSGKMGYAIAEAAQSRGAQVTLISGPTQLPKPKGIEFIAVESAKDMYEQVMKYRHADLIFMAAAVGDFSFAQSFSGKVNKNKMVKHLSLVPNPDILQALGEERHENQVIVGFSMETDQLLKKSLKKLQHKNADFIIANPLNEPDAGFGADTNRVWVIDRTGHIQKWPRYSKKELAGRLLDRVWPIRHLRRGRTIDRNATLHKNPS